MTGLAGTWLDLDIPADPNRSAAGMVPERKTGGGRHWTRTSDLLHVKQARPENAPRLTTTERKEPDVAQPNGWTLAGLRPTTLVLLAALTLIALAAYLWARGPELYVNGVLAGLVCGELWRRRGEFGL